MADLFSALDCAKISPGFLVLFGLTPGESLIRERPPPAPSGCPLMHKCNASSLSYSGTVVFSAGHMADAQTDSAELGMRSWGADAQTDRMSRPLVGIDRTAARKAVGMILHSAARTDTAEDVVADSGALGDAHRTCQLQFRPHDRRHSHTEGRTERARGPNNRSQNIRLHRSHGRGERSRRWRRIG